MQQEHDTLMKQILRELGRSQMWWHTSVVSSLERLRHKDHEFEPGKTLSQKQKQKPHKQTKIP
jgi:hypothetical protein